MDFDQIQAYAGFWGGAVVMISAHNMILSILLYKARQTNVSNILKIIFNFGNVLRFGGTWGTYMTPEIATLLQCSSLSYIIQFGNVFTRVSLTAFLLWRLRQINYNKIDNFAGTFLFLVRAGFGVAQIALQKPATRFNIGDGVTICDPNASVTQLFVEISVAVEVLVDIFVSFRLVQVLRRANRNAAQLSSNMANRSKRTLFTAVMYWNFLRLFVSLIFHLAPILNYIANQGDEVRDITFQSMVNIALSYVITVDAEIVKVIEGKGKRNDSSAGTDKSFKSLKSPRGQSSSNGLPKYSPYFDETHSQIDEEKIAVVSMKRLSFFEWANVVVGKRLRRNDDDDDERDENDGNTEEVIIDGPSEVAKGDAEKGYPDNRSSTLSGSTSLTESTLDDNPDIVIN